MLEAAAEVAAALAAEWWVAKEAAEEGGKRAVPVARALEQEEMEDARAANNHLGVQS